MYICMSTSSVRCSLPCSDPGYGATSVMLVQSALCIVKEKESLPSRLSIFNWLYVSCLRFSMKIYDCCHQSLCMVIVCQNCLFQIIRYTRALDIYMLYIIIIQGNLASL